VPCELPLVDEMSHAEEDVARFVQLTGSSTDQAAFMLEATHGDFERAVQMYFGKCQATFLGCWLRAQSCTCLTGSHCCVVRMCVPPQADSHQAPPPPRQPAQDASQLRRRPQAAPAAGTAAAAAGAGQHAAGPAQPRRQRGLPGLLGLPLKLLASGVHVMATVVQLTFGLAGTVGDKVLPASVMRAARGE
jgi:FAS-associated factor 2